MPRQRLIQSRSTRKRPKKPLSALQLDLMARLAALQAEMRQTHEGMANIAGVGRTTWTNWLNGENMPEEEAMIRLCAAGHVDMDWLYRGKIDRLNVGHAIRLTARIRGIDPDQATAAILTDAAA